MVDRSHFRTTVPRRRRRAPQCSTDAPLANDLFNTDLAALYDTTITTLREADNRYQRFIAEQVDARLDRAEGKHLMPAAPPNDAAHRRQLNRQLAVAGVGLVAALMGIAGVPAMPVVATGAATVALAPTVWRYTRRSVAERRLKYRAFGPGMRIVAAMVGFYATAGTMAFFYMATLKIAERSKDAAKLSMQAAFAMQAPPSVWLLIDGMEIEQPFEGVKAGDTIIIDAGGVIPIDGIVIEGEGAADQHTLTGEARLVEKQPGDRVFASTLLLRGRLFVRVEQAGAETAAARIASTLTEAADSRIEATERSERFADATVAPIMAASGAAFATMSLEAALTVTQAGLGSHAVTAGPLCTLTYLNLASRAGVLIKAGVALERLDDVDTMIFDKTGTLTLEQPEVVELHASGDVDPDTVLHLAAVAESRQTHPIAKAILSAARARGIAADVPEDAHYMLGKGISVQFAGRSIHVGSERFIIEQGAFPPPQAADWRAMALAEGGSLVFVAQGSACLGAIRLQAQLRPGAADLVQSLKAREIAVYVLSGDADGPTKRIAETLGLDGYFAEVMPADKATTIARFQDEGRSVCFVGDGVNDALALQQADVSISMRGATTLAMDSAQIVLMSESLEPIERVFVLSDEFHRTLSRTLTIGQTAGLTLIGGVFLFGFGMPAAMIVYTAGLGGSVWSALAPLDRLKEQDDPQM